MYFLQHAVFWQGSYRLFLLCDRITSSHLAYSCSSLEETLNRYI